MKNNLRKKLAIGAICLVSTFVGFGGRYVAGRKTQEVDHVSIHKEGTGASEYEAIRLYKPYSTDEVHVSLNRGDPNRIERGYFPVRKYVENSYGKNTEFSKRRIADIYRLVNLENK